MVLLAEKTVLSPLLGQLKWFVQLRWLAGLIGITLSLIHLKLLHWYPHEAALVATTCAIPLYNLVIWQMQRKLTADRRLEQRLLLMAWGQLLLDMVCLCALIVLTGGAAGPTRGFLVLHMFFASLLLPQMMAYGAAGAALTIFTTFLLTANQWPSTRDEVLSYVSTVVILPITVYLANKIMRGMRRQRAALIRQNQRIRAMSRQLKRQQQALVQHEKLAAMGQMAAGVTHEIANPLASMDSVLQLMQRRPERLRPEAVEKLREQVFRIQQIIRQMKTFAHPDDAICETRNLNDAVEEAINIIKFDARMKRVLLDAKLAPIAGDLPLVPNAVQQVLVNLMINALDAMADTEQPHLIVRTDRRDGWCIVEVTDNGHGIRPEHMSHLFEPFFTTKPVGKGTGLGLSISYSLIHRQGGSISVRSTPGQHTTFTVRLPADSQARESITKAIAASEKIRA